MSISSSRASRVECCCLEGGCLVSFLSRRLIGCSAVLALILAGVLGPLAPSRLNAQNVTLVPYITTVAGDPSGNYFVNGIPATSAALLDVDTVAVDRAGNLYIAEWSPGNRIRVVNMQTVPITIAGVTIQPGTIATVAGNGSDQYVQDNVAATTTPLGSASDMALDSTGNIYVAVPLLQRVRKVDVNGIITTVAGSGTAGYYGDGGPATGAELNSAHSIAVDKAGNLFIGDTGNHVVRKVDAQTHSISTIVGGGTICASPADGMGDGCPAASAYFNFITGITLDGQGNLFLADFADTRVRAVNVQSIPLTLAGMTIPPGYIAAVAGTGTAGAGADQIPATSSALSSPYKVTVDTAGNLYIPDFGSNRVRKVDASGTISTVAGNGTGGYAGDGGPAVSAEIWGPYSVAIDGADNLLIADYENARIRKVVNGPVPFFDVPIGSSNSELVRLSFNTPMTLGNVQVTNGEYAPALQGTCNPSGATPTAPTICTWIVTFTPVRPGPRWGSFVVTDDSGNKYSFGLEGTGIGSALAFTPGIISTVAGGGTGICSEHQTDSLGDGCPATSAVIDPDGVSVDSAGNLYITDYDENRVRKVDTSGTITTVAGTGTACAVSTDPCGDGGPATSAKLGYAETVAVDSAGNLYIADHVNNRVRKVNASGTISTVAGTGTACAVRTDPCGDGGPATSAELYYPAAVAVDSAGNLYISDNEDQRIRKVDTNGIITTVAGTGTACAVSTDPCGDGGPATSAELNGPTREVVDSAGNLYIADSINNRIRKVDVSGIITTVAGNGTAGYSGDTGKAINVELNYPTGVAVDSAGNLFIADLNNGLIRKVDTSGTITTLAGGVVSVCTTGNTDSLGDGCPANSAQLRGTSDVAVDNAGNLLIADDGDHRIRKVNVTTSALSFSTVSVGQTSSPQSVAVSDVGNAALNFSSFAVSPVSPPYFRLQSGDDDCATGTPLAIGATCSLVVQFIPLAPGPQGGALTVNDDASNTPQTVTLLGNGTSYPPATFSNLTPSQTIPQGTSSIILSGTISAGTNYPPIGETVSITIQGQSPITATIGSYGTFSGTINTATLPTGPYTITYSSQGDSSFTSASDSSTTLTVTSSEVLVMLNLTELGTGQGVVTDNFKQINCGENNGIPTPGETLCSTSYAYGIAVTLTASPSSGTTFGGWGGACASFGTGTTCSLTATESYGLNATANFIPPPNVVPLVIFSQGPGTNVTGIAAFACPTNPNPTPGNPCTDPNGHALKVTIPQVISAFPPNLTVTATEFQADGLCPPGGNGQGSDLDCRFVSFYNYGTDANNNTITPLCYPYANGNCVHYELSYANGSEPDPTLYSGGVFWKIEFNNDKSFFPTGYWAGSRPRMLDDPDANEVPPLPYGTNCSMPMLGSNGLAYPGPIYCQFDNDITTFYNPTEPVDAGIGGRTKATNDVVVAFLPTAPGSNPPLLPPSKSIPTITGSCVTGCVLSGNSITFTEGTGGTFAVTPTGFPAPTLTESGTLPSGLTFDATTGLISGTPTAGTAGNSIQFTASNVAGSATQIFSLTVSGLEISQTNVNFGTLYLGQIAARPITLTNTGTTPIIISSIKVTAPGNAVGDYGDITLCTPLLSKLPGTLRPGKSCKILVGALAAMKIFSPTASTATLTITDSVAGSPQSVPLTAQVINPQATISTYILAFPAQHVGTTSGAKTVTLTNTGNTPLTLGTLTISGSFALASGGGTACSNGETVAAGASCAITVTFTPTAKGTRTGSVKITDNALSSPQFIWLSGTGN